MLGVRAPKRSERGPLRFIDATAKMPAATRTPTIWPGPRSSRERSPGSEPPKVPTTSPLPRKRTATARKSRVEPLVTFFWETSSGDCFTGLLLTALRRGGVRATGVEGAEVTDLVARGIGPVVTVRADPLGLRPGREEPEQPGAQPHRTPEEPTLQATGDGVAEGAQQRLIHQRVGESTHGPLRSPAVRPEGGHQVERRVGHPASARVEGEVLALVVVEEPLEAGEVLG